MSKRVVLAGGSGFLGVSFANFLIEKGYEPVILTRGSDTQKNGIKYIHWDGQTLDKWQEEIDGSYAVVNFTGKSVNCLYTKKNKEEIISSRVNSVIAIREAINQSQNPPQALIQAGSLAIFGDTTQLCDENAPHADGFSAHVCKLWEEEFFRETFHKTRQVLFRIGFVLGKDGGALEPLKNLAKFNLGGTIGSGGQYISWLHIDDLNAMILEAIEKANYQGTYNATGPTPVTNKEFMETLRTAMGKGWALPTPSLIVKLGAYTVMRTDPSLALTGRNCIPKRLLDSGFTFQYTDLSNTLKELVN